MYHKLYSTPISPIPKSVVFDKIVDHAHCGVNSEIFFNDHPIKLKGDKKNLILVACSHFFHKSLELELNDHTHNILINFSLSSLTKFFFSTIFYISTSIDI